MRALTRRVVTFSDLEVAHPGPLRLGSLIEALTPARCESVALTHWVAIVAPGSGVSEALSLGPFAFCESPASWRGAPLRVRWDR